MTAPPLPAGFRVRTDPGARELEPGLWFGGSPARILRMTEAGQAAWRELRAGPVGSRAAGALARRLTDAGLAHPEPPAPAGAADVTVIVPARDRAHLLDRCLAGLGGAGTVVVVDDGSADPEAVAAAAARHGATLIRRPRSGGPAAARNTALASVTSDLVAFVDSDCVPGRGWVTALAAHFADPLVAAAAPRITARAPDTWVGRYTAASGALDLGGQAARVQPLSRVAYVPTAALVARRSALLDIARDGQVFDEALRHGEDVDLIWRLHEAGWRIRYEPAVEVGHTEPTTWAGLLRRRYRYGTSAAPLARRHPGAVPPLVLHPWPAATAAAVIARQPAVAVAAYAGSVVAMRRVLRRADIPRRGTARAMASAAGQTWLGIGRYGAQFAAPLLAAALAGPTVAPAGRRGPPGRTIGRRVMAGSLLLGSPLTAWAAGPRSLDPARFVLGRLADDIAYGLGVWSGCLAQRTAIPLRPVIARRPLRIDSAVPMVPEAPAARPRPAATTRRATAATTGTATTGTAGRR
ncbi:MAG TPA: mycofactocin biosynthesis glycosyltransferase MftF [Streptosporangiaceae bacterium]|nr:mycofactocin biosynthesis glycosyltransferase MftF [Streptosporangiaceae bacterium]